MVIFDLDGTITRRDTFNPFLYWCIRELGVRWGSLALAPVYLALFLVGLMSNTRVKELLLTAVLKGTARVDLDPVIERYTAHLARTGLNEAFVRKLSGHRERNDDVIIATASFDLYVRRLAEILGVTTVVCSIAEISDGRVTGRIAGRNCHGPEKLRRVEEACGSEANWSAATVYTDHYSDLPLLRRAARGILVNPGLRTRIRLRKYVFERFDEHDAVSRGSASDEGGDRVQTAEG